MILAALLAATHYLALALGLGGVFARALQRLLLSDTVWGVAALLWLATGLLRAFGHIEKQPVFYLRNGFFHLKMTLFLIVLLLELLPMITFIRWRIARGKKQDPVATARLDRLIRINDIEVALVVCIPFTASLMARGLWLF